MLEIPDKESRDGTLVTDGCAYIRQSEAVEIFAELPAPEDTSGMRSGYFTLNPHAERLVVLQIRIGGIKGLLVVYPDDIFEALCSKVNGGRDSRKVKLTFRPSMFKYPGGPRWIEVHQRSQRSTPARFNNAFVILLLTLNRRFIKVSLSIYSQTVNSDYSNSRRSP